MACRCDDIAAAEHDREVMRDMLDRICDTENRYNEIRNRYGDIINTMGMAIFLLEDEYNSAKQRIYQILKIRYREWKEKMNGFMHMMMTKEVKYEEITNSLEIFKYRSLAQCYRECKL